MRSRWSRDEQGFRLNVLIPANTTGRVYVPAKDPASIRASGQAVDRVAGVKLLRHQQGCKEHISPTVPLLLEGADVQFAPTPHHGTTLRHGPLRRPRTTERPSQRLPNSWTSRPYFPCRGGQSNGWRECRKSLPSRQHGSCRSARPHLQRWSWFVGETDDA